MRYNGTEADVVNSALSSQWTDTSQDQRPYSTAAAAAAAAAADDDDDDDSDDSVQRLALVAKRRVGNIRRSWRSK